MPESKQHIDLVKRIVFHIKGRYSDRNLFVLSDLPEEHSDNRPPKIIKYTPDVFAQNPITGFTIIGEAKITKDIEASHTIEQLLEFAGYLSHEEVCTVMFLSVFSEGTFSAQRLLNMVQSRYESPIKFFVLDGISEVLLG